MPTFTEQTQEGQSQQPTLVQGSAQAAQEQHRWEHPVRPPLPPHRAREKAREQNAPHHLEPEDTAAGTHARPREEQQHPRLSRSVDKLSDFIFHHFYFHDSGTKTCIIFKS